MLEYAINLAFGVTMIGFIVTIISASTEWIGKKIPPSLFVVTGLVFAAFFCLYAVLTSRGIYFLIAGLYVTVAVYIFGMDKRRMFL